MAFASFAALVDSAAYWSNSDEVLHALRCDSHNLAGLRQLVAVFVEPQDRIHPRAPLFARLLLVELVAATVEMKTATVHEWK
jgi:hypothetical protein